jgi:hypothetical protein
LNDWVNVVPLAVVRYVFPIVYTTSSNPPFDCVERVCHCPPYDSIREYDVYTSCPPSSVAVHDSASLPVRVTSQ